jgi:hypothetical protein
MGRASIVGTTLKTEAALPPSRITGCLSPFEHLNGFRYHDNWVRNLLITSSLNGRRPLPKEANTK